MKTRELVEALQGLLETRPEIADMEVWTEGCDCFGDVAGLAVRDSMLILARSSEEPMSLPEPEPAREWTLRARGKNGS
jgi:hypothetical protein